MSGQDGEGPTTEDIGSDHRVFWAVNMAFLVLGFLVCGLCWRFQHSRLLSGQFIVDLASAEAVRRQAEDKQTEIPPKERTIRLEASFARNNVTMVVEENDIGDEYIENPQRETLKTFALESNKDDQMYKEHNTEKIDPVVCDEETGIPATEENATMKEMYSASEKDDEEDENDLAGVDECETGYLIIPTAAATIASTRQVPNCCAICLSPYEVGETVVWSCNRHCKHAFHQDCMLDWLTKMFDGTPCPCCRQDFTDMATYQKPRTVKWDPTHAFNPNVIVLR